MKISFKYLAFIICLLVMTQVEAQGLEDAIGFDDGVADTPAAPISMLVPIALALGAFMGIKKIK